MPPVVIVLANVAGTVAAMVAGYLTRVVWSIVGGGAYLVMTLLAGPADRDPLRSFSSTEPVPQTR
jgi:hypothetical protein